MGPAGCAQQRTEVREQPSPAWLGGCHHERRPMPQDGRLRTDPCARDERSSAQWWVEEGEWKGGRRTAARPGGRGVGGKGEGKRKAERKEGASRDPASMGWSAKWAASGAGTPSTSTSTLYFILYE
eukprot:scaffold169977_cov27-Tisochrysis_lutea.AAC.2